MSKDNSFRRGATGYSGSTPSSAGKGYRVQPDSVTLNYSPTSLHQQRFNQMLDSEYSNLSPASKYKIYERSINSSINEEDIADEADIDSDAQEYSSSSPALRNDDKLLKHIAQMKVKRDTMIAEMEAAENQLSELQSRRKELEEYERIQRSLAQLQNAKASLQSLKGLSDRVQSLRGDNDGEEDVDSAALRAHLRQQSTTYSPDPSQRTPQQYRPAITGQQATRTPNDDRAAINGYSHGADLYRYLKSQQQRPDESRETEIFQSFSDNLEKQLARFPTDAARVEYLQRLLADTEKNIANFREPTPSASEYTDSGAESDRSDDVSYVSWRRDALTQRPQPQQRVVQPQRTPQQPQRTPQQVLRTPQPPQQRTPQQTPQQQQRTPQQPRTPQQALDELQHYRKQQQEHESLLAQLQEQQLKHQQLQEELERREVQKQALQQHQQTQQKWNTQFKDLHGFSQELTQLQSQLSGLLQSPALTQLKNPARQTQAQQTPQPIPRTPPRTQSAKRGSYPSPSSSRGLPNTSYINDLLRGRGPNQSVDNSILASTFDLTSANNTFEGDSSEYDDGAEYQEEYQEEEEQSYRTDTADEEGEIDPEELKRAIRFAATLPDPERTAFFRQMERYLDLVAAKHAATEKHNAVAATYASARTPTSARQAVSDVPPPVPPRPAYLIQNRAQQQQQMQQYQEQQAAQQLLQQQQLHQKLREQLQQQEDQLQHLLQLQQQFEQLRQPAQPQQAPLKQSTQQRPAPTTQFTRPRVSSVSSTSSLDANQSEKPDYADKLLTEITLFLDSHTPVDAMCLLSLVRELQELQGQNLLVRAYRALQALRTDPSEPIRVIGTPTTSSADIGKEEETSSPQRSAAATNSARHNYFIKNMMDYESPNKTSIAGSQTDTDEDDKRFSSTQVFMPTYQRNAAVVQSKAPVDVPDNTSFSTIQSEYDESSEQGYGTFEEKGDDEEEDEEGDDERETDEGQHPNSQMVKDLANQYTDEIINNEIIIKEVDLKLLAMLDPEDNGAARDGEPIMFTRQALVDLARFVIETMSGKGIKVSTRIPETLAKRLQPYLKKSIVSVKDGVVEAISDVLYDEMIYGVLQKEEMKRLQATDGASNVANASSSEEEIVSDNDEVHVTESADDKQSDRTDDVCSWENTRDRTNSFGSDSDFGLAAGVERVAAAAEADDAVDIDDLPDEPLRLLTTNNTNNTTATNTSTSTSTSNVNGTSEALNIPYRDEWQQKFIQEQEDPLKTIPGNAYVGEDVIAPEAFNNTSNATSTNTEDAATTTN